MLDKYCLPTMDQNLQRNRLSVTLQVPKHGWQDRAYLARCPGVRFAHPAEPWPVTPAKGKNSAQYKYKIFEEAKAFLN